MFTAILWDYDGTLANTPVKNIAVTRAVLGRLDPALLDPLPEALSLCLRLMPRRPFFPRSTPPGWRSPDGSRRSAQSAGGR